MKRTNLFFLALSILLVLAISLPVSVPAAEAPPALNVVKWGYPKAFSNVTINLVGDAGHNLRPYEFWKSEFE